MPLRGQETKEVVNISENPYGRKDSQMLQKGKLSNNPRRRRASEKTRGRKFSDILHYGKASWIPC
jgi:hypothetical protein